jgi:hypothetical protein
MENPWLRIGILLTNRPAVTACLCGKHTDMLELLDEIEQYIRPDNVLPDGFLFVDAGRLAGLDQFSGPCSAGLRAERVQEDVRVLVNQPTNQIGKVNRRPLFPQRVEQQPEFGVSLVAVPKQNSERLVFRDDRRTTDLIFDRIEFWSVEIPYPRSTVAASSPWSVSANRSVPSNNPSDSALRRACVPAPKPYSASSISVNSSPASGPC